MKLGRLGCVLGCALSLCGARGYAQTADSIPADSRITRVIVYPDAAFVTRSASVTLKPGSSVVVFASLVPSIDPDSLRVFARGSAAVKLFGAQLKEEQLPEAASARVQELQEKIQKLRDDQQGLQNQRQVLEEEKAILASLKNFSSVELPRELITKTATAKELDELLSVSSSRLKAIYEGQLALETAGRELAKQMDALRRELSQISGASQKATRSIEVALEAAKGGTLELSVSYLVRNASWQPVYDARARFEKADVELAAYGMVRQVTGEDWQEVELLLSTAKPSIGGRMPYIAPWFLKPYQPSAPLRKMSLEAKREKVAAQVAGFAGSESDRMMLDEELAVPAKPQEAEVGYGAVEAKGLSVTYTLPRKASVKSDGSEQKLPIQAQVLQASFEYTSCPRLSPFAYLGSRVRNAKEVQLLAGGVNVFLDDDFVGRSGIDTIGPEEEFDLYLGVDESVKVKREQIEKKVDETLFGNVGSPNKVIRFRYKLSVENYKGRAVKVKLYESMPVSQDERIKVKLGEVSEQPKEKDWENRKGVWKWEFDLAPRGKKEIFYTYTVEYPRGIEVEGL